MIETKRLILLPLTKDQLNKYIRNDHSLEKELNVNASNRSISPTLMEALEHTILPNVANPEKDYLFSTLWTIILKDENCQTGEICFVGEPNETGEVEIGYGTYDAFQKRGIMTEALSGMVSWAKLQPAVKSIIACTEKDNPASGSVLLKNHFVKAGESDQLYKWRLILK
ncbi:MAG: GNAT family N-acetyltransferase [Bacteroidales bacterium]|jgi:RimJ/RimL family protein N-acetyltransferase